MARNAFYRTRAGTFDLAVAGFAAVAIGFAGFALPEWRLYQLLSFAHLPDLLSAAQPPLGLKARLAAAIVFGGGAFAGAFLLMRMLDRPAPAARGAAAAMDRDAFGEVPIRLRRADAHPDNPARRPLAAHRDLGEPLDELLLDMPADSAPPGSRLPTFLMAEEAPPPAPYAEEVVDFIEVEPMPTVPVPGPVPEPALAAAPRVDRVFVDAPPPAVEPVEIAAPAAIVAPEPAAQIDRPVPAPSAEESLSMLMQRLESGLRKRETVAVAPAVTAAAPASAMAAPIQVPAEDDIADRLRTAMADLQRLAARG
jgi:hypothetical protein